MEIKDRIYKYDVGTIGSYKKARSEQSEVVKGYIRSLNYLSEDTIKLIK